MPKLKAAAWLVLDWHEGCLLNTSLDVCESGALSFFDDEFLVGICKQLAEA